MAAVPVPPQPPSRPLPEPFASSTTPLTLITQGAEALLYRTSFLTPSTPCALKIRPPKPWRHPTLDKRLTRQRILAEARVLVKCRKEGVDVPEVLGLDWEGGWVGVEWIEGGSVKEGLRGWIAQGKEGGEGDGDVEMREADVRGLMRRVGRAVGKLHAAGVVHGDLTTSNMMLRPVEGAAEGKNGGKLDGDIMLIDFGLATQAVQEEDRAVDLYVLERAFGSTHPSEEQYFPEVLEGYREVFNGAKGTLRRLEDVRMRGRKKSMIG